MKHGCYQVVRRDGLALILQYHHGRLVECLGPVQTTRRPKRRTTRRMGSSWGAVLEANRRAREVMLQRALYEDFRS